VARLGWKRRRRRRTHRGSLAGEIKLEKTYNKKKKKKIRAPARGRRVKEGLKENKRAADGPRIQRALNGF